ncbi:MAG: hypothetical protein M3Y76_11295 [Chloroflexota bacterium]|nr:hypothetical protein [Chloroflexota bacterium]
MTDNTTYPDYMLKGKKKRPISAPHTDEVIEWCMVILPIVFGLPALYCFLAMGGVFATVGPWMIFGATILFSKRLKKNLPLSFLMFKRSMRIVQLSSFNSMATSKFFSYSGNLLARVRESYKWRALVIAQASRGETATEEAGVVVTRHLRNSWRSKVRNELPFIIY